MFWIHRFYIQSAARRTILRPSEKKIQGVELIYDWLIDWYLTSSEQFYSYVQDENNLNATGVETRKGDG